MKILLFCISSLVISHIFAQSNLPQVTEGKIVRIEKFPSKYIDPRTVDIWLPPGFDKSQKYSVIYMHDGQMLFDPSKTWNKKEWKVDETLGALIRDKKIPPVIVVGIWNNGEKRRYEYMPQKPFEKLPISTQAEIRTTLMTITDHSPYPLLADNYLKFIVKELMPSINKLYPTYGDRSHTFIAGSSFGGMISWYALCEYPKVFGGAACLSTHWPGMFPGNMNAALPTEFYKYINKHFPVKNHRIYFDYGTESLDQYYEPYQQKVDSILRAKKMSSDNWVTQKFDGKDHSEGAWAERLAIPIQFLLHGQ